MAVSSKNSGFLALGHDVVVSWRSIIRSNQPSRTFLGTKPYLVGGADYSGKFSSHMPRQTFGQCNHVGRRVVALDALLNYGWQMFDQPIFRVVYEEVDMQDLLWLLGGFWFLALVFIMCVILPYSPK